MASSDRVVVMDPNTYNKYFHFRKTVAEMVCDRGYGTEEYLVPSFHDFRERFGWPENLNPETLGFRVSRLSDPSDTVEVLFPGDVPVTARQMEGIYNNQIKDKESLKKLIIVMFPKCQIDPRAQVAMQNWPFEVEVLDGMEMFYNPVRNDEGWKTYEVLTDDEKTAVVNRYISEGKEMPIMPKSHRIARYYDLEEGKVIRITKIRVAIDAPDRVTYLRIN